ncbi:preprotein translocase subunit SecE [Candidatus Saccharibacteria bacterium]|nr:preprotein translocase subunit SecE [Candidatus Saccharibacteria bacterium]
MPKEKKQKDKKSGKKVFILFRPFVAFFRYLRDSWREIRQVRWPSRKATWKMLLAVLVYTALFVVLITLLDLLFRWLFGMILGN